MHLTCHPLHVGLEVHLITRSRSISEINLTLCHRLIWDVWHMLLSIVPVLWTFLPPLIRAEIVLVLRFGWVVLLLLEEHPRQLYVAVVHHQVL